MRGKDLTTVVIIYGLCLGFLAVIKYFDLSDFFFSPAGKELIIPAIIFGALQVIICFIIYFRPEWANHFRNDDNFID